MLVKSESGRLAKTGDGRSSADASVQKMGQGCRQGYEKTEHQAPQDLVEWRQSHCREFLLLLEIK